MNAKKSLLKLSPLLLFVLLINIVNAQEDFIATTSPSVELCPCSNQAYAVTVQNIGSVSSTYTLLAGGDAAEWVTFNPRNFILEPGQAGNFFVFVNSVCNIEGNFNLEIFIKTGNGLTKVVKQILEFSQCYDYSLQQGMVVDTAEESINYLQHDGPYDLCANEQSSMPILITNNENFENQYRLFLDAPEWAELNAKDVGLNANQSGVFLVNLDTTDVTGTFNFKLDAISVLGEIQRKKNIEVNVGECYALDVNLEKERDVVCGNEEVNYDVIIKNVGILGYGIDLEVDGPEWARFENASLYLDPEEEGEAILRVSPPSDLSESFVITVNANPEEKEVRFSDTLNIDAIKKQACYQANINTRSSVSNIYKEDLFFAEVINDGIKKTTYTVSLEGPDWVSVSPESLELNPGQTGNLNLRLNPSDDIEPGTYDVKINVDSEGSVYSKDVNIKLKRESEFIKSLKSTIKFYQYYIYLGIAILILIAVFIRPILRAKNKAKERYKKYRIKRERLRALKLARKEKREEKQREIEKKEEERKKKLKSKKEKRREIKAPWKKYKAWLYSVVAIVVLVLVGHYNGLYNLKYTNIYLRNIFYGYLYYMLMGVGVVVALFLALLLYNYFGKERKAKKRIKKEEKRKERWYDKPFNVIIILAPILILIGLLAYFNLFDEIRDFFVLYSYYFVLGIIVLAIIIIAISLYKPLQKFLKG